MVCDVSLVLCDVAVIALAPTLPKTHCHGSK